jgi:plastocyanin
MQGDDMMRRVVVLLLSAVLIGGLLAACGGNKSSAPANTGAPAAESPHPPSATAPQPPGPQIVITDFAYAVPPSVKPGERVTLINKAEQAHSVTADQANLFDVRVSGSGGVSTLVAPAQPGSYPFHCKYHANMAGTLTVQ